MPLITHSYKVKVDWTGNDGYGTKTYQSYQRTHKISVDGKPATINGSSDPAFLGDNSKYNPEELFLASLAACHMLWYLHLCSQNNIIVMTYEDHAEAILIENADGSGQFTSVTLNPFTEITEPSMSQKALELHERANRMCFIANSCNFKVLHNPKIKSM